MKNVIFIPKEMGRGRHHSYDYSIKSWRHWLTIMIVKYWFGTLKYILGMR